MTATALPDTSVADHVASLPKRERERFYAKLTEEDAARLRYDWNFWARPNQIAPDGDWQTWLCMAGRGWGKLLDVHTPLPTPDGWTTMGDVRAGQQVLDEQGRPTTVTYGSDLMLDRAYVVRFSDGEEIVAHGDHEWATLTHAARKARGRPPQGHFAQDAGVYVNREPQVVTTNGIRTTLLHGGRERNHAIPTTEPLVLPLIMLPIEPYTLGAWLGDGSSAAAEITVGRGDEEVIGNIAADGYTIRPRAIYRDKTPVYGIGGLHVTLRVESLLRNKHVPSRYLRAAEDQRLALLQGLMDTDGGVEGASTVSFVNTREALADAVYELVCSLGMKATRRKRPAMLYGIEHGTAYEVTFTPTMPVFRLKRKAERVRFDVAQQTKRKLRYITAVEPVGKRVMRCIAVDTPSHLYLAGQGMIPTHNTRTGAEFVRSNLDRVERWALVAPTASDGRDVMVRGESGLLAVFPPDERPLYEPSKRLVSFRNGSIGLIYSAEEPERLRGPQFGGAWCDEAGAWKYRDETWDLLQPALRLGAHPRQIVTTTPRPVKMIRDLLTDPDCVVSHGTTFENVQNLAPSFAAHMRKRYEGTTMGRQELYAELLDEYPGAFWTREVLERNRVKSVELEEMQRIVVAVDPAATAGEEADQTGIVVAGKSHDGLYYVLAAEGVRMSPHGWASRVLDAFDRYQADRIVAEVNNGGDMVVSTLQNERRDIPVRTIHASRGKSVRAEPIAALYEQDKVKHLGSLDALEDQQVAFPVASDLDDLVDAAVYALTELSGGQDFDTSAFPDPGELSQTNAWANA